MIGIMHGCGSYRDFALLANLLPLSALRVPYFRRAQAHNMKGVSILFDERKKKRIVQIDMDAIRKDPEGLEDLMDVLVAESRKGEPTISLDDYVKSVKRKTKR